LFLLGIIELTDLVGYRIIQRVRWDACIDAEPPGILEHLPALQLELPG